MNHRKFGKKLGRNHHERQALFKSQTRALFTPGAIETTEAKAKALISIVEGLATTITTKTEVIAQRELGKLIQDRNLVSLIYTNFKAAFGEQKCNFTKMTRIKFRQGDDALIVKLAFVKPYNAKPVEVKKEEPVKKETVKKVKSTKGRSSEGGKKA